MDRRHLIVGPNCVLDLEAQRAIATFDSGLTYSWQPSVASSPLNSSIFASISSSELRVYDARAADAAGVIAPTVSVKARNKLAAPASLHFKDQNTVSSVRVLI
jgi:hypothetical protein